MSRIQPKGTFYSPHEPRYDIFSGDFFKRRFFYACGRERALKSRIPNNWNLNVQTNYLEPKRSLLSINLKENRKKTEDLLYSLFQFSTNISSFFLFFFFKSTQILDFFLIFVLKLLCNQINFMYLFL